jgi:hypothetical protein
MRITSAGNVGIATTNPQTDLMIGNADGSSRSIAIHTANNGNARLRFREGATVSSGYNEYSFGMVGGDNALTWEMQGYGERMRLTDAGNLGIGTTSPGAKLSVSGALGVSTYSEVARFSNTSLNSGAKLTFYGVQGSQAFTTLYGSIGFNATYNQDANGQAAFIIETGNNGSVSESARVTYDGNLLVGTTANNYRLNVKGGGTVGDSSVYAQFTTLDTGTTATDGLLVGLGVGSSPAAYVNQYENAPLIFLTNGTERMRIASNGLLLQGSTSATFAMPSINGASFKTSQTAGGSPIVEIGNTDTTSSSDGSPALMVFKGSATTTSDARFIQFSANGSGTTMGAIVGNGSGLCQFANYSDISLKKNIQPLSGSLAKIIALKPSSFDMVSDNDHVNAGFIAQDVQKVYPEYVIENMANEGEKPLMAITGGMSGGFIAELVKAIQELKAEFDEYKTTHP